jgi:Family of unknown function (DUF5994)
MISDLLDTSGDLPDQRELRLKTKPSTATRGNVDGGWWPRSTDPAAEILVGNGVSHDEQLDAECCR